MESLGIWHWVIILVVLVAVFAPILWVIASERSHGGAKLGWLLLVICFSWLGLAAFLIITQAQKDRFSQGKS